MRTLLSAEHLKAPTEEQLRNTVCAARLLGVDLPPGAGPRDQLASLYRHIVRTYPDEYVIKNELINRIFLARHDVRRAAVLPELCVGENRLDLVVVNGTTTAYEIKSRFDSLTRVAAQTATALRTFDRVYVVCPAASVEGVIGRVDQRVGIMVMGPRGTFTTLRRHEDNIANVTHEAIFEVMRKPEYEKVIRRRFGRLPKATPVMARTAALDVFRALPVRAAHDDLKAVLLERGQGRRDDEQIGVVPYALQNAFFGLRPAERDLLVLP